MSNVSVEEGNEEDDADFEEAVEIDRSEHSEQPGCATTASATLPSSQPYARGKAGDQGGRCLSRSLLATRKKHKAKGLACEPDRLQLRPPALLRPLKGTPARTWVGPAFDSVLPHEGKPHKRRSQGADEEQDTDSSGN